MNFEHLSDEKAKEIVSMYKYDLKDMFMYKSVAKALERADEYTGLVKKLQGLDLDVVEAFQIKQVHPAFDVYSTWPVVRIRINGDPKDSYKIFSQAFSDKLQFYISLAKANPSNPKIIHSNSKQGIKSYSEVKRLFEPHFDGNTPEIFRIGINGTSRGSKVEDISIVYGLDVKPTIRLKDKAMNMISKKYVDLL
ncbi:MAG: hypothetical protein ACMXX9_02660 [Candidatus Woesearchaeota archaeon]